MFKSIAALLNSPRTPGSLVILGSMLFFCATTAQAAQVALAWDANTESNLSGYTVYYGQASGNYTDNVDVSNRTSYMIGNLQDGRTYYFAVRAYGYNSNGQMIQSDYSNEVSQTVGTLSGNSVNCHPCNLWGNGATPTVGASADTDAVELGVNFKSDVSGAITGLRFYKDSSNTGTHIANLWTSNGTLLATATFTNETASGWQEVNFPSPALITANTVYVASYHTNTGHYVDGQYEFGGKGVDNPPLQALPDGVAGANGVYAYGSSSSFPSQSWRSSIYWVRCGI